MTRTQIAEIFKNIVIDFPECYCFPFDGFAFPDRLPVWGSPTLGLSYIDYEQGNFWARSWVDKGADPDDICFEYAGLILEQKRFKVDPFRENRGSFQFYLVTIDQIGCPNCPTDCDRTEGKIREQLFHSHRYILGQFFKTEKFEYTEAPGGPVLTIWATLDKMQALLAEGSIISFTAKGDSIEAMLSPNNPIEIDAWGEGMQENFIAFFSEIWLDVCFDSDHLCNS